MVARADDMGKRGLANLTRADQTHDRKALEQGLDPASMERSIDKRRQIH